MTVDLNRALLDLSEKGEKGYTKDIEKLDKLAEKMHEFASKDHPEIPLSKDNKDDPNRLLRAHTTDARVRYFINNHDYKKPFLHASKLPTENKRDNFIYSVKGQMRDDFYDAKKLLSTKPELFANKEKEELNKLFSSVDKQGGIGKYFEKNFGMEAPETEAKEMVEQAKSGKAKEGFEFQAKTSALRDNDAGRVYSFTVDAKEYAQKGQLHPKERKGINIDINSTQKQREAAIKDVAKNFKEDLQTTRNKLASGKLDGFLSPSEKETLKEKLKEIDKMGGGDKFIEQSFGKYAPESVKEKNKTKQQAVSKSANEQVKSFKAKSSKDGEQLFSDKDKQNMVDRFGSKGKEISNEVKKFSTPDGKAQLKDAFNKIKSNDKLKETAKEAYSKFVSKDASEQVKSFKSKSSKDGNQLFSDKDKQNMVERFGSKSKLVNKAKEIANNKDVKPILSGNSSPKLNTPSKSIGGR